MITPRMYQVKYDASLRTVLSNFRFTLWGPAPHHSLKNRIFFWLPARWTSGFSGDHQQDHQCLWLLLCYTFILSFIACILLEIKLLLLLLGSEIPRIMPWLRPCICLIPEKLEFINLPSLLIPHSDWTNRHKTHFNPTKVIKFGENSVWIRYWFIFVGLGLVYIRQSLDILLWPDDRRLLHNGETQNGHRSSSCETSTHFTAVSRDIIGTFFNLWITYVY